MENIAKKIYFPFLTPFFVTFLLISPFNTLCHPFLTNERLINILYNPLYKIPYKGKSNGFI